MVNNNKKQKNKVKNTDLLNIEREMSESFGHKVEIETRDILQQKLHENVLNGSTDRP